MTATAALVKPCLTADPALFDDETDPWPAKSLCLRCRDQYACRWDALHTDVAGVVGGLTEAEREQWREAWGVTVTAPDASEYLDDVTAFRDQLGVGRRTAPYALGIVQRHTEAGESASEIGAFLGVSQRAVVRMRSRLAADGARA